MVAISHTHRFVYLKTRKTGGTSVEMYLEPFCRPAGTEILEKTPARVSAAGIVGRRLWQGEELGALEKRWRNHMSAKAVKRHLGEDRFEGYGRIAVVRNPFDRAVSYFYWRAANGRIAVPADLAGARDSLRAFVDSPGFRNDYDVTHIGRRWVVDHLLHFETLMPDLRALSAALELDPARTALPHAKDNRAARAHGVAELCDAGIAARVRAHCAWMFERGGYSPDPGAAGRGAG